MRNKIPMNGCSPEPLSSYLKSLSLLRLVSEQKDSTARAWWEDDILYLESTLDERGLVRFFLDEYSPTPIVAPWGGGSGFSEGNDITGPEAIRASTSEQFEDYREVINEILSWPEISATAGLSLGKMIEIVEQAAVKSAGKKQTDLLEPVQQTRLALETITKLALPADPLQLSVNDLEAYAVLPNRASQEEKDNSKAIKQLVKAAGKVRTVVKKLSREAGKEELVRLCRNRLNDRVIDWIDAAVLIVEKLGKAEAFTPLPLMGTGGNEGNKDYTNAFMRHVSALLLPKASSGQAEKLLRHALFNEATTGLVRDSVGQHDPGRAGGYNQGHGIELENYPMNPWNFVLTLEGIVAWASGVTRRQGLATGITSSSAFTVRASAVGYSSSSSKDEEKARAEIWTPLWERPTCYAELQALLREGRAEVGRRQATNGIEFAESVASLGVDRGISSFVRYSLLKRRGDSYVALPSGRFPVQTQARSEADLVRKLEPILSPIDGFLNRFGKNEPPARFTSQRRALDETIYQLLLRGGKTYAKAVIAALGRLERLFAERDRTKEPRLRAPLSGLDSRWLLAADDGSLEIRIAAALASIRSTDKVGSFRANLTAIDPQKPWAWGQGKGQTAWSGISLAQKLANVLQHRMMDADRLQCRANPTWGNLALATDDIVAFIEGGFDESLVEDMLFGFSLIRWDDRETCGQVEAELTARWSQPVRQCIIPRSWALLKHLFLPTPIKTNAGQEITIRPEPSIIPKLCANLIGDACAVAARRLFAAGLVPTRARIPNTENGTRIAAALLLPVRQPKGLMRLVLHTNED